MPDGDTIFPAFRGPPGLVPACHLPHRAAASVASLTCCVVVAGPKVSAVHLSVLIRTWKLFNNSLYF